MSEVEARLQHLHDRLDSSNADHVRLLDIVQHLEDAMLVQAHLEKRQAEQLKTHAEIVTRTERNLAEMTDKINVLYTYLMRRDNLPEAPQ